MSAFDYWRTIIVKQEDVRFWLQADISYTFRLTTKADLSSGDRASPDATLEISHQAELASKIISENNLSGVVQ